MKIYFVPGTLGLHTEAQIMVIWEIVKALFISGAYCDIAHSHSHSHSTALRNAEVRSGLFWREFYPGKFKFHVNNSETVNSRIEEEEDITQNM